MVKEKLLLEIQKHQYHASLFGEHNCSTQSQKEWRLLQESKFDSFYKKALIIKELVEKKDSLAKPKHQYRVSECGEHDCSA